MSTGDANGGEALGSAPGSGEALRIGAHVVAEDGDCGELVRVVVDPVAGVLTHIVVAPRHHPGLGKLVPLEIVQDADADTVHLSGGVESFSQLDDAEDTHFLADTTDRFGRSSDVLSWPFFGLAAPLGGGQGDPMYEDRVPAGEVLVRRGDAVCATDGEIGSVQGLVIDPADHHVTHVLLKEGHVWGRKQVAIPIGAATRLGAVIRVGLTKQQIEDLPAIELRSDH